MRWYERIAAALDEKGISRAEVGRRMTPVVTGQAITQKLQGKRPVSVEELKVMAGLAGMTVAEAVGDDAVVIENEDEMALVEFFRLMGKDQRKMLLGLAGQLTAGAKSEQAEEAK